MKMTIDEYILSHSDEEGALLSAEPGCECEPASSANAVGASARADIEDVLPDDSSEKSLRSGLIRLMPLCVWRKAWKRGVDPYDRDQ